MTDGPIPPPDLEAELAALRANDSESRRQAVAALVGRGAPVVEFLLPSLVGEADDRVRVVLIKTLARLGPAATDARMALERLVGDRTAAVGRAALDALLALGPEGLEAIEHRLASGSEASRRMLITRLVECLGPSEGVESLPGIGRNLLRAGPALLARFFELLDDGPSEIRPHVGDLLARLPVVRPKLLELLEDEDPVRRARAARCLGQDPSAAEDVVGPLLVHLKDEDRDVRRSVAAALGTFADRSEVVWDLLIALADDDPGVRMLVVGALHLRAPATDEVTVAVAALTTEPVAAVREAAVAAVGRFARDFEGGIHPLVAARDDGEARIRSAAAGALALAGRATVEARIALRGLIGEDEADDEVQRVAVAAWNRLGFTE